METVKIPLHEFEQHIGEAILGRGLSYFKKGHVHEPVEVTPGVYEAIVSGSEDYTVQLIIKNGNIIQQTCDCPYDGGVCKHVVAVIFYLQQDTLEIVPVAGKPAKNGKKKTAPKKKTVQDQVGDLLNKISYDELKQFIRDKSVKDASFRGLFLSAFIHLEDNGSKEFYQKQIKAALQAILGRKAFIYREETRKVEKAMQEILATAQKHAGSGNYNSAIMICCAVMEKMVDVIGYADDSNGYIGDTIEAAYELLFDFAVSGLPAEERKSLFEYALSAFQQGIYSGWDWHVSMLELAGELAADDNEMLEIIKLADTIEASSYIEEQLQLIKLDLLLKMNKQEHAGQLMEEHLSKPAFRRLALETAFDNRDFEKVIQLAKNGVQQDKDLRGLVFEWQQWLLKIAQEQQDKKNIIAHARTLFMNSFGNGADYYQIMKDNVDKEIWTSFVENIVSELLSGRSWPGIELALAIYIKEEWWERLLKHISKYPNPRELELYEEYLSGQYSNELIGLYLQCVPGYAESANSRSNYKDVCRYLKSMIRLGAQEQVRRLVAEFMVKYKQRRAFMEELNTLWYGE